MIRTNKTHLLLVGAAIVTLLFLFLSSTHTTLKQHVKTISELTGIKARKASLASTVGIVRYNSERKERLHSLERYAPFFHSIHHSMPLHDKPYYREKVSLTSDNWIDSFLAYRGVADTMQVLLSDYPEVTGILYFHFDAWLDPKGFKNMNYTNIWWPTRQERALGSGMAVSDSGPIFGCYQFDQQKKDQAHEWPWHWWFFRDNQYPPVLDAVNRLVDDSAYPIKRGEFCTGWSDFYYIPRRFFKDWIHLSNVFESHGAFHEVVVPTMITVIDRMHRESPNHSVIDHITDCWGDCCSSNPSVLDVEKHRCGHRMDWLNAEITLAVLSRLEKQKAELESQW